jgi:AcrR family transcriptional regulator
MGEDRMKKEDLRVKKTKASLYRGLMNLMKGKAFEDIKVSDICNESLVNRSTFYDHFNDKYELFASLMDSLKEELITSLKVENYDYENVTDIKSFYLEIFKLLLEYIELHIDIYSSIIKSNNNSIAHDMLKDVALTSVNNHIKENYINESNIPVEVLSMFYVSAVINVCVEYLREPNKFNHDDICTWISNLLPDFDYLKPKKKELNA